QPAYVFLYFSYITLATVGYGDFTAADAVGRLLAMLEGLVGQLYLVTVLALIVSNLGRQRNPAKERAAMRADGPDGDPPPDDPPAAP
ncbi:MAG: potassium channel family protein, partial [Actinomycetota bacterium]